MGYYIPDDMWEAMDGQPRKAQDAFFGAVARLFFTGEAEVPTGPARIAYVSFRERVLKSRTNYMNKSRHPASKQGTGCQRNSESVDNEIDNPLPTNSAENSEGNPESAIKGGGGGRGGDRDGGDLPGGKSKTPLIAPQAAEIVGYLNAKAGSSFSPKSESTLKLIRARMADGFSVEDFKLVIDNKCAEWSGDPKMSRYLRPSTLFCASKFEEYLNGGANGKRKTPYSDLF
jgi:uncharacterized phage protein (TIGR02220 family)